MEDIDPLVTEDKVPSYKIIEEKIREIDNTIIIFRIYYLLTTFKYRFQLIKKDRMCIVEVPRKLLESLGTDGTKADQVLTRILNSNIDNEECWADIKG